MKKTLTVNIDLDDIRYYRGIHALPEQPENGEIFCSGVPRFLDMCEKFGIRATLFVISQDMDIDAGKKAITDAAARGHEIASHTVSHDYSISRQPPDRIRDELTKSKATLEEISGITITGFRGPGYNLSPDLLDALVEAGYRYDTSVMSSPPYWMARAGIIAGMRLLGKKSSSIPGRAHDFMRGKRPFVWKGPGRGLVEFPISTGGVLAMPVIGTTLAGKGPLTRHMLNNTTGLDFVNIEFHAIDFLDQEGDGLEKELLVEPALKIPLEKRIANFESALARLSKGRRTPALADLTDETSRCLS